MHPDTILSRIKELGTKAQVAKAKHKHKDASRLIHDEDGSQYAEKLKALSCIMVEVEKDSLKDSGIISFLELLNHPGQIEVRYKHTEAEPLYHRISLEYAFVEGGRSLRIVDLPKHADWFEGDVLELEAALAADARLWFDRLGIPNPISAENVAFY